MTCLPIWCRSGAPATPPGWRTVVRTFRSAPRPPGASMVVAPDGSVSGSVSGGCVEGAVYELATEVAAHRHAAAGAVRDQRRRRLRRRAHLRRHPRHLRRGRFAGNVSRTRRGGRRHRRAPAGRGRDRHRPSGRAVGGPPARRRARRSAAGSLGSAARRRRRHRRRPRPAGAGPQRDPRPTARTGSVAARAWRSSSPATRRARGCWCSARSTSPPRWRGRDRSSATASRCATPARCVRHAAALPDRRRGRRRLAAPLSGRAGRGGRDRRAHGDLRAHPRPEVRRAGAGGRAAPADVGYVGAMGSRRTHDDRMAPTAGGGADRRRAEPGCPARSDWTWARAPRRRPRCRSPPTSSPAGGAAVGAAGRDRRAGSTTTSQDVQVRAS